MGKMEQAKEQIKTLRNLCDIALLVVESGKVLLLPTILELLHIETARVVEEHCIADEHK